MSRFWTTSKFNLPYLKKTQSRSCVDSSKPAIMLWGYVNWPCGGFCYFEAVSFAPCRYIIY
jgi:hypothetical protein